jgi:hypothetical protein
MRGENVKQTAPGCGEVRQEFDIVFNPPPDIILEDVIRRNADRKDEGPNERI